MVLVGSGCLATTPAPPPFPGLGGTITPYTGSDCKTVLVAGDSLAAQLGESLKDELATSGRCADVVNDAVAGTSVGDWAPGGVDDLGHFLDTVHPDLVVIHFIGNEGTAGPQWDDPNYIADAAADATQIINEAKSRGIPIYWVLPPIAAWNCDFTQQSALRFVEWEHWVASTASGLTGEPLVDWHLPFGGDHYSAAFTFPSGVQVVRAPDCVHFDFTPGNGQVIAADATVLAIEDQWTESGSTSATGPVAPPGPSATGTTAPTTTTSSGPPTSTSTSSPR